MFLLDTYSKVERQLSCAIGSFFFGQSERVYNKLSSSPKDSIEQ